MPESFASGSAAAAGFVSCRTCAKLSPLGTPRCPRCNAPLHARKPYAVQRTVALLITAALLYIPSNTLPILTTRAFGQNVSDTILSSVIYFWQHGDYLVATVIFAASVVIPIIKILSLAWLVYSVSHRGQRSPRQRTRLYRLTEIIGRWSMVDVFVVAVMVALVQLGVIIHVYPGPAAVAFAGVVLLTMFAAMSFDPRLIWDRLESDKNPSSVVWNTDPKKVP